MRELTLAGFAVLALALVGFQVWGAVTRRTVTLGDLVGVVVRPPVGRWLLLAAWLWLGWHLFVRVSV